MSGTGYSLKSLLALVAWACVGAFALLNASRIWVTVVYSVTVTALLIALLALPCQPSPRRAFWLGFAIFGWGYLLIADNVYRDDSLDLPTHAALEWLHGVVSQDVDAAFLGPIPNGTQTLLEERIAQDGLPVYHQIVESPVKPYFDRIGDCLLLIGISILGWSKPGYAM